IDPAPSEIYTLSLHDALPISPRSRLRRNRAFGANFDLGTLGNHAASLGKRRNREQKKKCKCVFHGFPQRTYSEDVFGCRMSCPARNSMFVLNAPNEQRLIVAKDP